MAQQCTVCAHMDADRINVALVQGSTLDALSKAYGLTIAALHRHKKHIPAQLVKAKEAQAVASADSLMARVATLNSRAEYVYTQALKEKNLTVAIGAVRELRGITELYAKITGELQAQTVNNIIVMPQWMTLRNSILYALGPYPEAKQAVILALGGMET